MSCIEQRRKEIFDFKVSEGLFPIHQTILENKIKKEFNDENMFTSSVLTVKI